MSPKPCVPGSAFAQLELDGGAKGRYKLILPLAPPPSWYLLIDGQRVGPLTVGEIRKAWRERAFDLATSAQASGESEWQTLAHFPELREIANEKKATRIYEAEPWPNDQGEATAVDACWADDGDFSTSVSDFSTSVSDFSNILVDTSTEAGDFSATHTAKTSPTLSSARIEFLPRLTAPTPLPPIESPLRRSLRSLRAHGTRGTRPRPTRITPIPLLPLRPSAAPRSTGSLPLDRATARLSKGSTSPISAAHMSALTTPTRAANSDASRTEINKPLGGHDIADARLGTERKMLAALLVALLVLMFMHS